jgi:hypothetical protein
MTTFTLVLGDSCRNGADVVAVHRGSEYGVVLAKWRSEFVTWMFRVDDERSTYHGHYFIYGAEGEGRPNMEDALRRAKTDYLARVTKYI